MIQSRGWVELYVRHRLAPADSAAFEEHYFECDRCFADVEEMERFIGGVREAGRRGLLTGISDSRPRASWLMPAFVFAVAALALLSAGLAYFALVRLPASEAQVREALEKSQQAETRLAQLEQRAALDAAPQANVPVVILTAARGADETNRLTLGKQIRSAVLWIDIPPQPAGAKFRLTLTDGKTTRTIEDLERNENGALAATVPVSDLSPGQYVVRLYGEQSTAKLIGEYRITVSQK